VARGGRDSISHAPGSHDDVANAVCGALTDVIADRRPTLLRRNDLMNDDGAALPLPASCKFVCAVLTADEFGMIGIVYSAITHFGPKLIIADFDAGPLRKNIFSTILVRTRELALQCKTSYASIFAPHDLAAHAIAAGLPVEVIPEELDPEALLLSVAAHVAAGDVKISTVVAEKSQTAPFLGALNFRAGENANDPLRRTSILTVALALDPEVTTT
jgi:hypothetical protein